MSTTSETVAGWWAAHRARLEAAVEASCSRTHYAPFIESPSRRFHPEGARDRGQAAFEAQLGRSYPLQLPGEVGRVGEEVSPYTGEALGIDYPQVDPEQMIPAILAAWPAWRRATPQTRMACCLELVGRLEGDMFRNAWSTMHTAGQGFMLAFAGAGASALERGLEGLALSWRALRAVPERATFERRFGRGPAVVLDKRYRLRGRGLAVVIACGSYPSWNAWPALLANLVCGNPVVLKPHPRSILAMARTVELGRAVLAEAGFDPNLLTLAADTVAAPITWPLVRHPAVRIVDFTGSPGFGQRLERELPGVRVFTETAGTNAAVIESAADIDAALRAVAGSLSLFSAQMCTAAQNLFVPRDAVREGGRALAHEELTRRLLAAIEQLVGSPEHAAGLCGAICDPALPGRFEALAAAVEAGAPVDARDDAPAEVRARRRLLRQATPYVHPQFPRARTLTPLVIECAVEDTLYRREHFGPVGFLIPTLDRAQALRRATEDAARVGAIASYAWSLDPDFCDDCEDAFAAAGASLGLNLIRQLPINFAAAFSDFHVTGLNPAGSATLTDLAFVASRFCVVQSKRERPLDPT